MADPACANCGAPLAGRFCAQCGQKVAPLNPRLRDFVRDLTHELLHLDRRVFRSVGRLLFTPGRLTREHVEGRRAGWISPIRLYLVFSVVYFTLAPLGPGDPDVSTDDIGDQQAIAALRQLGFENEEAVERALQDAGTRWGPRLMFVLVPLFAWFVRLAWRRKAPNYPQHLYFAFHVHAAWFAAGALVAAARLAAPSLVSGGVDRLPLIYGVVYAVLAFRTAYGATFRQAALRMAAVLVAYSLVVLVVALGVALAVIFVRV